MKHTIETRTSVKYEIAQTLAVDTAAQSTSLRDVVYKVETTYEKRGNKYSLKQILYNCAAANRTSILTVKNTKTDAVQEIAGREY